MTPTVRGGLHHIELWVPDLLRAKHSWGWLLSELGYESFQDWPAGCSWKLGDTYLVVEQSTALTAAIHERCRPGLNHVAFYAGTQSEVDRLVNLAPTYGWVILFPDRNPYSGSPDHYAAYLENEDGFEVELVAVGG